MRKLIPFFLSLLLLAGCATPAEQEPSYRQISTDEAIAMMEEENDYIILDVRTPEEFAEKHIPDAINIPNETIGTHTLALKISHKQTYSDCTDTNRKTPAAIAVAGV